MANTVKLKRSAVASAVPTTTQLELGELAINTNDGKLFLKRDNGTESIVQVGSSLITDNGTRVTVGGPTTLTAPNTSAAAWLTSGINLVVSPATFTDTTSSGTIGDVYINRFGAQTLAATSATTVTRLFGTYFASPIGGTNVTASNPYALGADSLRVEGTVFVAASGAGTVQLSSGTTTGQTILGGTSQTGNMTLGQSTVSQTTNIQAGATASGSTKTINIGTGSLAGSTTTITIGSSNGTSTVGVNGAVTVAGNISATSATSRVFLGTDSGGSISIGRVDNTSSSPYIDFNSGATTVDFDARIAATSGTGTSGQGTLTVTAATTAVTGVISSPLGSAAAPSYTFTGDTNTGMWSPGADTLAFSEGGVEAMRINSSGIVAIGRTTGLEGSLTLADYINIARNTDGWLLKHQRTDDSRQMGLYADGHTTPNLAVYTNGSERMRVTSGGNVGIGTSSPGAKLDVRLANIADGTNGGIINVYSTTAQAANIGGKIDLGGLYDGSNSLSFASVAGRKENSTSGDWSGYMQFSTRRFGADFVERMRIDSSGNVGIGTGSPTTIFHVQQNNSANIGMRMRQLSTTQFAGAGLLCNGPVSSGVQGGTAFYHYNRNTGGTNGALAMAQFDENGSFQRSLAEYYYNEQAWLFYTNGSERLRITNAGNVGIGTSAPSNLLHIARSSGNAIFRVQDTSSTSDTYYISDSNGTSITQTGALPVILKTTNTERMRIDASGKVLIGGGTINAALGDMVLSKQSAGTATFALESQGSWNATISASAAGNMVFSNPAATERMRIDSSGNVGIGTSSPAYLLHLNQNGNTQAWISATNVGSNSAGIGFENQGQRNWQIWADRTNDALQFGNNSRATTNMVINSSGNVGIGTTSPPQQLAIGNATDQIGLGASGTVATLYFGAPSSGSGGIKRLAYDRASGALSFIGGGIGALSTQMTIASAGEVTAAVDFRAPIFYDSNDTSAFVNPAGASFIKGGFQMNVASASNDVFGGLEMREAGLVANTQTAATYAPGINFHWGSIAAARLYMNSSGDFVFAGQGDITNNRRGIYFSTSYAATDSRAPIFYDSANTAFYVDAASTTNINIMSGNGKTMFETADSYLRINQSSTFSSGTWFGGVLVRGDGVYAGSNGGTTNSRVYMSSGTYNGTNVISLDGSNGRITASDIRAPIFYDTDNTGFYVNPAGDTNLNKTFTYLGGKDVNANWNTGFQNTPAQAYNFHGDISSGGPSGTWWFYESMRHSNASNYWGTQIAWGWEDNANRLFQRNVTGGSFGSWVEYLNTSNRTYNGNLNMTGSIISTSSDVRAPIFYDQNDTGYYVDPNSGTSAVFAGDIVMGPELNMVTGARSDRYIDVKGDLYFRYSDNSTFYTSRMLIRSSGAILSYADFESSGNITAYASDRRLKTNITPIQNALEKVMSIGGYTFDWDVDKCEQHGFLPTQVHEHGVIAQEIEAIMPDVVVHAPFDKETRPNHDMGSSKSGEWFKTVNYDKIVPLLIEAIKEQQACISNMQKEIEILKGDK